jgi:hypothetical protein
MSRSDLPLEDKTVTFEEERGISSRSELKDVTNGHLTQIVLHGLAIKLAKVSAPIASLTSMQLYDACTMIAAVVGSSSSLCLYRTEYPRRTEVLVHIYQRFHAMAK